MWLSVDLSLSLPMFCLCHFVYRCQCENGSVFVFSHCVVNTGVTNVWDARYLADSFEKFTVLMWFSVELSLSLQKFCLCQHFCLCQVCHCHCLCLFSSCCQHRCYLCVGRSLSGGLCAKLVYVPPNLTFIAPHSGQFTLKDWISPLHSPFFYQWL